MTKPKPRVLRTTMQRALQRQRKRLELLLRVRESQLHALRRRLEQVNRDILSEEQLSRLRGLLAEITSRYQAEISPALWAELDAAIYHGQSKYPVRVMRLYEGRAAEVQKVN